MFFLQNSPAQHSSGEHQAKERRYASNNSECKLCTLKMKPSVIAKFYEGSYGRRTGIDFDEDDMGMIAKPISRDS